MYYIRWDTARYWITVILTSTHVICRLLYVVSFFWLAIICRFATTKITETTRTTTITTPAATTTAATIASVGSSFINTTTTAKFGAFLLTPRYILQTDSVSLYLLWLGPNIHIGSEIMSSTVQYDWLNYWLDKFRAHVICHAPSALLTDFDIYLMLFFISREPWNRKPKYL